MKKITIFLIVFIVFQFDTLAQYTSIPDLNFEQELINNGSDTEGVLDSQILTIDAVAFSGDLNIANKGILDLTGIEAFINITGINFNYNTGITDVDLSNCTSLLNISGIGCTSLTSVNVSGLLSLITLNLRSAGLLSLDVTSNVALKNLNVRKNSLSSLDLSQNPVIDNIDLKQNNLTYLDLRNGNQADMVHFDSDNNPDLTCIFFDDASLIDRDEHIVWFIDDLSYCLVDNEIECNMCMNTLTINDTVEVTYNMYPNPADSSLHVTTKAENSKFSIYSITGKIILTKDLHQNNNIIDVSSLASGLYITSLISDNQIDTKKLIIK